MYARYKIKLLSRLCTPLQSDTIFGHLCWGIRYLRGEDYLQVFLEQCASDPPVLISCAFPEGCLPRPVLAPLQRERLKSLALDWAGKEERLREKSEREQLFRGMEKLKSIRKIQWLSIGQWLKLREGVDEEKVIRELWQTGNRGYELHRDVHAHSTIDRHSGKVLKPGGLYFVREWWADRGHKFDLYVWFGSKQYQELWEEVWQAYIQPTGFGKDKSTGAGQLAVERDKEFEAMSLFEMQNPNAWMSLSLLAFKRLPSMVCRYFPKAKFGKLGGDFAVHGKEGGKANPFKKPLLMLEPGAVFESDIPPQGDLLANVHEDERIRHYGLGLCLPLRISGGEA